MLTLTEILRRCYVRLLDIVHACRRTPRYPRHALLITPTAGRVRCRPVPCPPPMGLLIHVHEPTPGPDLSGPDQAL